MEWIPNSILYAQIHKDRYWCVIKGIGLNHNAFIYLRQLVNTTEHTLTFYYVRFEYPQEGGNCRRISTGEWKFKRNIQGGGVVD